MAALWQILPSEIPSRLPKAAKGSAFPHFLVCVLEQIGWANIGVSNSDRIDESQARSQNNFPSQKTSRRVFSNKLGPYGEGVMPKLDSQLKLAQRKGGNTPTSLEQNCQQSQRAFGQASDRGSQMRTVGWFGNSPSSRDWPPWVENLARIADSCITHWKRPSFLPPCKNLVFWQKKWREINQDAMYYSRTDDAQSRMLGGKLTTGLLSHCWIL